MALPGYAMNQSAFPDMYERWLVGPLFRPWAETIVAELGVSRGDRVLDVAGSQRVKESSPVDWNSWKAQDEVCPSQNRRAETCR